MARPGLLEAGAWEFAIAAAAVVCGALGWACLLEGPGLFRHVPLPPRSFVCVT